MLVALFWAKAAGLDLLSSSYLICNNSYAERFEYSDRDSAVSRLPIVCGNRSPQRTIVFAGLGRS